MNNLNLLIGFLTPQVRPAASLCASIGANTRLAWRVAAAFVFSAWGTGAWGRHDLYNLLMGFPTPLVRAAYGCA